MSTLRTTQIIHGSSAIDNIVLDNQGRAIFGPNSTAGRAALYVNAQNNRVGVNTETPSVELDVDGQINVTGNASFSGVVSLTGDLNVDSNTLFVDASTNRVGINTNTPSTDLTIGSQAPGSGAVGTLGVFLSRAGATTNFYEAYDGTKSMIAGVDSTNNYVKIGSFSSTPVGFVTGNSPRMQVNADGRVSIGTQATTYQPLTIHGGSATAYVQFFDDNTGMGLTEGAIVGQDNSNFYIWNYETGSIEMATAGDSRLIINSTGKVGINNGSPDTTLDIGGALFFRPTDEVLPNENGAGIRLNASTSRFEIQALQWTPSVVYYDITYSGLRHRWNVNGAPSMLLDASHVLQLTQVATPVVPVDTYGLLHVANYTNANAGITIENARDYGWGTGIRFKMPMISNGASVLSHQLNMGWEANDRSYMAFSNWNSSTFERGRFISQGHFKARGDNSSYVTPISGGSSYNHELSSATSGFDILQMYHTSSTNPYGVYLSFNTTVPNNTTNYFFYCNSGGQKAAIYSNGGLHNFQANNVNLCDQREKKDVTETESKWNDVKRWEIKKFHYNSDDNSTPLKYGVIAQQIEKVTPEVLDVWVKQREEKAVYDEDNKLVTPAVEKIERKGVKEQQMMWISIKTLQEAMQKIEDLETRIATLENN